MKFVVSNFKYFLYFDFLIICKFSFPVIYIENKYTIHVIATYVPCIVCVFVNKFFKWAVTYWILSLGYSDNQNILHLFRHFELWLPYWYEIWNFLNFNILAQSKIPFKQAIEH